MDVTLRGECLPEISAFPRPFRRVESPFSVEKYSSGRARRFPLLSDSPGHVVAAAVPNTEGKRER